MLDLGFDLAAERAGIGPVRPVCYVEREAYAAANLVAKMGAGVLDAAPVWSDVGTVTGPECRAYLGRAGVDAIVGGIPCQPFSLAGKRLYSDDPRDLLGKTLELVEAFAPEWVALENVAGFVVPDGLGRLAEGLDQLGYDVAAILLRASDVGASHGRARVFILAHSESTGRRWNGLPSRLGAELPQPSCHSRGMADAQRGRPRGRGDGDSPGHGRQIQTAGRFGELGNSPSFRLKGRDAQDSDYGSGLPDLGQRSRALFAPAKNDTAAWLRTLHERPDLCPSLPSLTLDAGHDEASAQSLVRGMAHGLARAMEQRTSRLRLVGNGVVPLQAAVAYSLLFDALGGTR